MASAWRDWVAVPPVVIVDRAEGGAVARDFQAKDQPVGGPDGRGREDEAEKGSTEVKADPLRHRVEAGADSL